MAPTPALCFFCNRHIKTQNPKSTIVRTGNGVIIPRPTCAHCRHKVKKGVLKTGV